MDPAGLGPAELGPAKLGPAERSRTSVTRGRFGLGQIRSETVGPRRDRRQSRISPGEGEYNTWKPYSHDPERS